MSTNRLRMPRGACSTFRIAVGRGVSLGRVSWSFRVHLMSRRTWSTAIPFASCAYSMARRCGPTSLPTTMRRLRTVSCDQLDGQVSIYCLYRRLVTISTIKLNLQAFVSRACRTNKGLGQRLERDRSFRYTLGRRKRPLPWISTARHFCWCLIHLDETVTARTFASTERPMPGSAPARSPRAGRARRPGFGQHGG